jgi:glycosyltransferase involved in cell wall biosynthesis
MKILVINYEYPPLGGGGGVFTKDLYEQIVKQGHPTTVVTSKYPGASEYEVLNGVEILRVPVLLRDQMAVANLFSMLSYPPAAILKAVFNKRLRDYDVINTHFAVPSGPAGYILGKILRLPNILSVHGGDIFDPSKRLSPHRMAPLRQTVKMMIEKADCVVAQSCDTANNVRKYYTLPSRLERIPLGIPRPVVQSKKRADFQIEKDDFVFCTIGRLVKRKNLEDALNALAMIKMDCRVKLLIIGEGPQKPHLQELIQKLDLKEQVRLLGSVSDEVKFQLLGISDAYLSTASHEGFGIVFLEAMAMGLPVICYNRGGQTDFLRDGKTGFVVPLGDREILQNNMRSLIKDQELQKKMAQNNLAAMADYYIESSARQYINLFEEIITASANRNKK